ncbi:MAG: tRNA (N6-isopentenyl adenosine(37)-C2)-methylthiotransferase MiaB [Endomicrobiaceae bacterium]|nr:tRNA (N6-isopentenyl adenosine(37)-C2)-methylthiotransferase MiaB [Endomicrobiaceae bacterium]
MNNNKFFIETIGCQMNVNDSDKMAEFLSEKGYFRTNDMSQADIVIVNTCSVRFSAEHKAYSLLGRLKEQKDINPKLIIGVTGCMAEYAAKEIKSRCKFVDFVLGAKKTELFPETISKFISETENGSNNKQENDEVFKYITIMRGCSNFCSYCIVPHVRGPEVSIDYNEIIKEVNKACTDGIKEIILLGQNVNSYNYEGVNFTQLLQKISQIDKVQRIRFMTNHPKDFSDELIEEISKNKKICRHIHLPLQSGSDTILKAMNRKYTYEQYETLYKKIKSKIPDINITSDIIIGFPGETDQDFQATFDASRNLKFGGLFIFKYSPRPKTFAAKLKNNVPLDTIKQRHSLLLEDSNIISKNINEKYIDKIIEVLVERVNNGVAEARNSQNIKVFFDTQENLKGKIVNVKITKVLPNSMSGILQ